MLHREASVAASVQTSLGLSVTVVGWTDHRECRAASHERTRAYYCHVMDVHIASSAEPHPRTVAACANTWLRRSPRPRIYTHTRQTRLFSLAALLCPQKLAGAQQGQHASGLPSRPDFPCSRTVVVVGPVPVPGVLREYVSGSSLPRAASQLKPETSIRSPSRLQFVPCVPVLCVVGVCCVCVLFVVCIVCVRARVRPNNTKPWIAREIRNTAIWDWI